MPQLNLFKNTKPTKKGQNPVGRPRKRPEDCFGGAYFKDYNPREARPMSPKKALHLTLRSSMAKGRLSMKRPDLAGIIWDIIEKHAQKNGVRLYEYANAGNHLHLLIRVKRQDDYRRFIRAITGLIARAVKGCERGRPLRGKFWDARPFTRIVDFAGDQFKKVKLYIARNRCEALGFIKFSERRSNKTTPEWQKFWSLYTSIP